MIKQLLKAALVVVTLAGFQTITVASASADIGGADTDLTRYSAIPDADRANVNLFEPFKVASRRSRRRNRAIAGGVAVGIAALIIADAVRSSRRKRHHYSYYDDSPRYRTRYYRRSYYPVRACRKWARRCDYGNIRACRKWNRRCR